MFDGAQLFLFTLCFGNGYVNMQVLGRSEITATPPYFSIHVIQRASFATLDVVFRQAASKCALISCTEHTVRLAYSGKISNLFSHRLFLQLSNIQAMPIQPR